MMINFIKANWLLFVTIFVFVLASIILWRRGKKSYVKNAIYLLVCLAEQQFGSGTGPIKWIMVYNGLPWWVRWLFPQELLAQYIDEAVQYLKQQLKNKDFNLLTYNEEAPVSYSIK